MSTFNTYYRVLFGAFNGEGEEKEFPTYKEAKDWIRDNLFPGVPYRIERHSERVLKSGVR